MTRAAVLDEVARLLCARDGLREQWDDVVYLDSSIERAEGRGIARDAELLGGADAARAAYRARYTAACRIYLDEQDPRGRASIVVDHDDPLRPRLIGSHIESSPMAGSEEPPGRHR